MAKKKGKKQYWGPRKGSTYQEQQKEKVVTLMSIAMDTGAQQIIDYVACVLHDPEVMGKDTFGRKRIDKIVAAINARSMHYANAYNGSHVESDVLQEELDAELREVYGDDMTCFRDRYPGIDIPEYNKPKKTWVQ